MKLSTKIGMGFGVLLVITVILGIISIYSMNLAKNNAIELNTVNVNELRISKALKDNMQNLMYEMRAYGFTGDPKYYESSITHLKSFKTSLLEAEKTINSNKKLAFMENDIKNIQDKLEIYEGLIENTRKIREEDMPKTMDRMINLIVEFSKNSKAYLESQDKKLMAVLKENPEDIIEQIEDRNHKKNLINQIIEITGEARVSNLKGQLYEDFESIEQSITYFDEINEIVVDLRKVSKQQDNIRQLDIINRNSSEYQKSMKEYFQLFIKLNEIAIKRNEAGNSVLKICNQSSDSSLNSTVKIAEKTNKSASASSSLLYIVVIAALIIGITIAILLTKSIIKPIVRVVDELANGSDQVFNASEQLSLASQELADGSSEQASSIEETSSTLDETSSMVKQNTENTKKAADLTQQAREMSLEGNEQMKIMMNAMDDIKNSSNEIAKIIKVIDDIAFQTNMLALNAAVEAARAGEAGMGFAVVAEEVRILAQRSTQAAKDTSEMIENSINKSEKGVDIAAKVAKFLENIYGQSEKINEIVKEITTASQEQTQGVIQISKAVSQMEQVTQSIASNAEESAAASEQLNAQAENMKQIVGDLNFFIYATHRRHHPSKNKSSSLKSPEKKSVEVRAEDVISLEDDPLDF